MSLHPWNYYSTPPPEGKLGPSWHCWTGRHRLLLRGPLEAVCLPLTTMFDHIWLCSAHSLPNPSPTPHSFSTFFSTTDSGVSPCAIGHDRIATPVDHWVGFFDIREFFFCIWSRQCWPYPVDKQWTELSCVVHWKSATHGCTLLEGEPCKSELSRFILSNLVLPKGTRFTSSTRTEQRKQLRPSFLQWCLALGVVVECRSGRGEGNSREEVRTENRLEIGPGEPKKFEWMSQLSTLAAICLIWTWWIKLARVWIHEIKMQSYTPDEDRDLFVIIWKQTQMITSTSG